MTTEGIKKTIQNLLEKAHGLAVEGDWESVLGILDRVFNPLLITITGHYWLRLIPTNIKTLHYRTLLIP